MDKKLEIRYCGTLRAGEGESRLVEGLAIPVESESALLFNDFYEMITRDAINDSVISDNDVKIYVNHDPSQGTYARSKFGKGSLSLSIEDDGLHFRFEAPRTSKGDELLEGLRRGDYDKCSFGFIPGDDEKYFKREDGYYQRVINSIELLDEISILSVTPAYDLTSVNTRSLDKFKDEEKRQEQELLDKKIKDYEHTLDDIMKLDEYKI